MESIKAHGGNPWHHLKLAEKHSARILKEMIAEEPRGAAVTDDRYGDLSDAAEEKGMQAADDEFLGCMFILGADNKRYKSLKVALANSFVFGTDDYPKNQTQARALLKHYRQPDGEKRSNNNNNNNPNNADGSGVALVGAGKPAPRDKSNDECFICGDEGHHGRD